MGTIEGSNKRSRATLSSDEEEEPVTVASWSTEVSAFDETAQPKRKKPHITGIKRQSRYDPGVSMTKEELKAWRKEARRVRNRESAAASRRKNREAITKLETEVEDMKTKYCEALRYILQLEDERQQIGAGSSSTSATSLLLRQDLQEMKKSPKSMPDDVAAYIDSKVMPVQHTAPSPLTPSEDRLPQEVPVQPRRQCPVEVEARNARDKNKSILHHPNCHRHHRRPTFYSQQHIIDTTISRPIAAKIHPGANENTSNDDNDDEREKDDAAVVSDTPVSDDDNDSTVNTLTGASTVFSTTGSNGPKVRNNCHFSPSYGSDDESTIESDQPLFLDTIPVSSSSSTPGKKSCTNAGTCTGPHTHSDSNEDSAVIAEFLKGVFIVETGTATNPPFQSTADAIAPEPPTVLPDFDLGLTAADMEALLLDGDNNETLLSDPCLEN